MPRFGTSHPVHQLRDEMDRVFSGWFGPQGAAARLVSGQNFPVINVWEAGDELFAEAEVPGLKSEDLDISVVGNELTIKGQRPELEQEGTAYHRRERGVGPFTRTLRLPVEIDGDRVEATLANGVLTIKLPKAEAAKPRKIQVNSQR